MASIGGTITHSPNTSGSDICWVLFHSSDINPIHQLFCQLPLSGLRGDCSFGGSEYWFILAPHLLLVKFDWIFFSSRLPRTPSFFELPTTFPEPEIWLWMLAFSKHTAAGARSCGVSNINITVKRFVIAAHVSSSTSPASVGAWIQTCSPHVC